MSKKSLRTAHLSSKVRLGVNIDHIATIREARKDIWPDILEAAKAAIKGGADQITVHLREDRRHIQDKDVFTLKKYLSSKAVRHLTYDLRPTNYDFPLNLEMAVSAEIIKIAHKVKPFMVTLVPEKRQELTTEGGLNVKKGLKKIKNAAKQLQHSGIIVSLFIDPDHNQITASKESGATHIELHTGTYAQEFQKGGLYKANFELQKLKKASEYAQKLGLIVNAGHGLTYQNVKPIAEIKNMHELNIGHNIVARAVLVGLEKAVKEMKILLKKLN